MKIAVSTDQGYVSAHFGRCQSYTIFEVKEGQVQSREEVPNPGHQPDFLPDFLSRKGVHCIIAGGMGPRAQALFAEKDIETVIGVQGPVEEVIERFIKQELKPGEDLCGHRHGEGHSPDAELPCEHSHAAGDKICITARGKDLESEVDPNFGRARYFLIVDPRSMRLDALDNPNTDAAQGAGIRSARLISDQKVAAVLTGQCGPHAQRVLESAGIKVVSNIRGRVRDALLRYTSGSD